MKRILTYATLAVVVLATTARAQEQPDPKARTGGGFGGFGPSVGFVDYEGLNSELTEAGFDELNATHWLLGGGGYAHIDRIVLGGSGWGGTQSVSADVRIVRVSIGGGMFEAGYSLLTWEHLIVTPMLGIGGSGYSITVEGLYYPEDFGEFLEQPGPVSSVGFSGFTLAPELVLTIPVRFVGLQLRGGYACTPGTPDWRFPGGAGLMRGPDVARGMPFAALYVVFGGFNREGVRR